MTAVIIGGISLLALIALRAIRECDPDGRVEPWIFAVGQGGAGHGGSNHDANGPDANGGSYEGGRGDCPGSDSGGHD